MKKLQEIKKVMDEPIAIAGLVLGTSAGFIGASLPNLISYSEFKTIYLFPNIVSFVWGVVLLFTWLLLVLKCIKSKQEDKND